MWMQLNHLLNGGSGNKTKRGIKFEAGMKEGDEAIANSFNEFFSGSLYKNYNL